jgi:regulator of replication initiation timing
MDQESQVDFNPENFFNREPSPEQEDQQDSQPTDLYIRDVIAQQDPKMLEAGVSQSLKILQNLKQIFSRYAEDSPDALAWTVAIEKLIPQAQRKRTVVGVVGNTGAGKSSVINAMLDEERLVPTNCMRACTAVVTEMSWNDSTDPFSKYRAQIEFIARADWEKEVGILMKEFMTESGGVSREIADENSDAGIAWAKFHSVYPKITRDSLNDCTVESLMSEKSVLAVLGTTKKINTATPYTFYQQLQRYVDSKEKVSKKGKDKEKDTCKAKKSFGLEFWPLIKVVKIYVKAPALSTGAVIVDLPGVHDSNAARAAVAQGYMKQCTGLWIVAPINRAVDDKAAKTLLGDSFKRQLKYDGGFSSVTFICSKTDDISITEAIDTLELEDEVQELYEQQQRLEDQIKDAKEKIDDLKEEQDVYRIAQSEAASEIEVWEQLKDSLDDGETVYAPTAKSKKRKNSRRDSARKRRQGHDDGDDVFIVSDEGDPSTESDCDSDTADVQPPLTPLTEGDIKTKIRELRDTKKTSRREGILRTEKIELRHQIPEYEKNIKKIKADISHICIAGRNDYSKRAIQQDFAAGIKELDQENAAEEDEENFNPDEELRDYDEVARSLPVFCVSSRAYQKLCGRMQKDGSVPGFKTPEETEVSAFVTRLTPGAAMVSSPIRYTERVGQPRDHEHRTAMHMSTCPVLSRLCSLDGVEGT